MVGDKKPSYFKLKFHQTKANVYPEIKQRPSLKKKMIVVLRAQVAHTVFFQQFSFVLCFSPCFFVFNLIIC